MASPVSRSSMTIRTRRPRPGRRSSIVRRWTTSSAARTSPTARRFVSCRASIPAAPAYRPTTSGPSIASVSWRPPTSAAASSGRRRSRSAAAASTWCEPRRRASCGGKTFRRGQVMSGADGTYGHVRLQPKESAMSVHLLVVYPPPKDPTEFDRAYREEHLPYAGPRLLGATRVTNKRVLGAPGGNPFAHAISFVAFPSAALSKTCAQSKGGQEALQHAAPISTAGPPHFLPVDHAPYTACPPGEAPP